MCGRLFSSIPGLYPPPQVSTPHPPKKSSKVARCPRGEGKGIKLAWWRTTDGDCAFSLEQCGPVVTLILFFLNIYLFFIYLAMLSLSCSTWVILVVASGV